MNGATEILEFRLKHHMAPSVVWVFVGPNQVNPIMDHPCEVFIHIDEPVATLDLRALHGLTLCVSMFGCPSSRITEYLDALTAVNPARVVATWKEDETDECVTRWWTPKHGWGNDWHGGKAA